LGHGKPAIVFGKPCDPRLIELNALGAMP